MSQLAKTTNEGVSISERFTANVLAKFASENGTQNVSAFQKRLIQSYFVKLDQVLKLAEINRLKKSEQNREPLPYTWNNVNMDKLAVDVVAFSSVGLDPMQKNHLHPIPYKNNTTGKYDISFTIGYNGLEIKARKYGLNPPTEVIIRLVYKNEKFVPIYKDKDNQIENYIHVPAENPFEKGEVVGGYYYYLYPEQPEKNVLRVFSIADIRKRIPKTASAEFWGGEKKKYNSQETETVEGWFDEMAWKTIKRAAFDAIPIDSEKIDKHIQKLIQSEDESEEIIEAISMDVTNVKTEVKAEVAKNNAIETLEIKNVQEVNPQSDVQTLMFEPEKIEHLKKSSPNF